LTRDLEYKQKIEAIVEKARSMGRNITTAAEYMGMKPDLLEARRKEIYELKKGTDS